MHWFLEGSAAVVLSCVMAGQVAGQVFGPDFNGDGFADLAAGTPDEDFHGKPEAGIVHILYGSAAGLAVIGNQIWSADSLGGDSLPNSIFGSALGWGDLNGDGFDDLVIAARTETVNGVTGAGAIYILFGSVTGLTENGAKHWHQDTPGITGAAESDDEFGYAVAVADFNSDGFGDIAVGAPGEGVGSKARAGAVHIFYGSSGGPKTAGDQLWHQSVSGVRGSCGTGDEFGKALAPGDFNNDGFMDLAIGVPGETVSGAAGAGAVNVLYGSSQGLTAVNDQLWTLDTSGILGAADAVDSFGRALAAADYNGDGFDDLAVGMPDKDIGNATLAGAVTIIFGTSNRLRSAGNQFWTANASGLGNSAGAGDAFGWKIAAGDFNNDGKSDLAIGIPNKQISGIIRAGAVQVLYGKSNGLGASGARLFHQNTSGIASVPEPHDRFGYGVAARDFNGDGFADLAIGAPYDSVGSVSEAGVLHILRGTSSGLVTSSGKTFTQATPGIDEIPETGDEFADYF